MIVLVVARANSAPTTEGKVTIVPLQERPGTVVLPLAHSSIQPGLYRLVLPLRFLPQPGFEAGRLNPRVTMLDAARLIKSWAFSLAQMDGSTNTWTELEFDLSLPSPPSTPRLTLSWSWAEQTGAAERQIQGASADQAAVGTPTAQLDDEMMSNLLDGIRQAPEGLDQSAFPALLAAGARLERVSMLAVEQVRPAKVHVYPGEANPIAVTVRHYGDAPIEARVQVALHRGLDEIEPLGDRRLTVPASGIATTVFDWVADQRQYGYAAVAIVSADGNGAHTNREFFSVSEPIWKTAIHGNGFISWEGREHLFKAHVENNRRAYINVEEAFSWAPCSWTDLNPTNEIWWTGQNDYRNSLKGLREWLNLSRANGIKMINYSWAAVNGKRGYDFARRFPDILTRYDGGISPPDLEDLNLRNILDERPELWRYRSGQWLMHYVNLGLLRTMEHHAREVIRSAQTFGWDGLRFDYPPAWSSMGTDGVLQEIEAMGLTETMRKLMPEQMRQTGGTWSQDDISTRNVRFFRHLVTETLGPRFALSYNNGLTEPLPDDKRWWFQELCRNGGQIMNEPIRRAGSMRRYADIVWWHTEAVRQAGGYGCVFPIENLNAPLAAAYAAIFTLASGSHPYLDYGWLSPLPGAYTAFATRYAEFLWDLDLAPVAPTEAGLTVSAPQPLLWERYVRRHERDGKRRIIVHLINLREGDPDKAVQYPQAIWQRGLSVSLHGVNTPRAYLLTAEPKPTAVPLTVTREDGYYSVTIPELRFWAMVVWEHPL